MFALSIGDRYAARSVLLRWGLSIGDRYAARLLSLRWGLSIGDRYAVPAEPASTPLSRKPTEAWVIHQWPSLISRLGCMIDYRRLDDQPISSSTGESMIKKICSIVVACLLTISVIGQQSASASSKPDKDAKFAAKVKAAIVQLGTGQSSLVNIKLRDKTRLTGYVSEIGDASFVVTDSKTAGTTTVAYPEVAQVKGENLSTRTKIIIAAAVIAGVAITLYIVRGAFCDGC